MSHTTCLLFKGIGVEYTVVELPDGCSVGRYAVAVSLERSKDPKMPQKLVKRGLGNKAVYDFTFDYNFKSLQGRASSVLLRIDYSDVPGYWDEVICKCPTPYYLRVAHQLNSASW
jgi:chitinase